MEYIKINQLSALIGWSEQTIKKRICMSMPMPPSVKIPRSKVRLWKLSAVYAWLDAQLNKQAANDERLIEMNEQVSKAKEVRKKIGRPRKQVNFELLEKLIVNA